MSYSQLLINRYSRNVDGKTPEGDIDNDLSAKH